jgi:hypothetical protein
MSFTNDIKTDLHTLAEAQLAFDLNGWEKIDSIQRDPLDNTQAWGTVYQKNDKTFYLNINSATKALQVLRRVP